MMNRPIYFDNASTSFPKPDIVFSGMKMFADAIGYSPFRLEASGKNSAEELIYSTRQLIAKQWGIQDPFKISFTYNATYALNILLKGFLKTDDHVIISNFEHNSVIRPLHQLAKSMPISLSVWESNPQGFFALEDLNKLIRSNTRLIFVNHISNVLGIEVPLEKVSHVAKSNGIMLGVDCTQSVGHLSLELEGLGVDMAAGTGHKALLGPSGIGFLYVKDSNKVSGLVQGGGGYLSHSFDHPNRSPEKYEAGTLNYFGIAGLFHSMSWLAENNLALEKSKRYLTSLMQQELRALSFITVYGDDTLRKAPIVSINVQGFDPQTISKFLYDQYSIITRSGLQCAPLIHKTLGTLPHGTLRISLGAFNNESELDVLLTALKVISARKYI